MAKTHQDSQEMDPLQKMLGPSDIEAFVDKYKVQLLLGFIGIIVLICVAFVMKGASETRQTKLAYDYTSATTIDELESVATKYRGSVVGGNAIIRKAELLEEAGNKDEAWDALQGFLANYPDHPRRDQVLMVLGRMAEGKENWDEARSYYQQVALDSEEIANAKIHLGDLLMQEGKFEEAERYYDNIQAEVGGTVWYRVWQLHRDVAKKRVAAMNHPGVPEIPEEAVPAPDAVPEESASAETTAKPEAEAQDASKPEAEAKTPATTVEESVPKAGESADAKEETPAQPES